MLGLTLASCGKSTLTVSHRDAGANTRDGLVSDDGTCPEPTSPCGTGANARCYVLADDPMNCGACGRACTPGVTCVAGACQNVKCTGTPTFHRIATYPPSLEDSHYLGADMNRDGRLDLIEHVQDGSKLAMWLGNPDGTFTATDRYPTTGTAQTRSLPDYATVGDFNEDGLADLVVTIKDDSDVHVRLGQVGGGLGPPSGALSFLLQSGDLDGDGHLDLVTTAPHPNNGPSQILVLRGRGDGTFAGPTRYTILDETAWSEAVIDWNGDGALDILAMGYSGLHILYGRGDGSFADDEHCGVAGGLPVDLNQDGLLDIVWTIWPTQTLATILGQGGCDFTPRKDYGLPPVAPALAIGDITGDGFPDVLVGHDATTASFFVTNPDGTLSPRTEVAIDTTDVWIMWIADVTSDGRADVVCGGSRGLEVYANDCDR